MKLNCTECSLKYEKEPGFFQGAMYVSYSLQVALFVTLFTFNTLLWQLNPTVIVSIIIALIIGLFPITYRWSRIVWMNFFMAYEKEYDVDKMDIKQEKI